MNKKAKYLLIAISLSFVVGLGIFRSNIPQVWAYIDPSVFPTIFRSDVASSDIDGAPVAIAAEKANVLFLIDVGSAMIFTPKGQLPDWRAEYVKYAPKPTGSFNTSVWNNPTAVANANATTSAQMAQCTFGSGGLTAVPVQYTSTNYTYASYRSGRDLDPTNNAQGNPDNYYNTSVLGYPPNDSRLYKMKLVLWRMLDEASLFDQLRFGLATTYQEEMTPSNGLTADFYKVSPFGATTGFPDGVGPDWATGPGKNSTVNAQPIQWGVDVTAYNDPNTVYPTSSVWFAINRAYLRIPFGDNTTAHVRKFRKLIDGVEDNNVDTSATPLFRIKDPEIVGDGRTPLANSIFPATKYNGAIVNIRDTMINGTGPSGNVKRIYYSRRTSDIKRTQSYGFHWFGKASGEAAGTVLDFFSPPVAGKGANYTAEDALNAQRGNFPIRNRCENNWLIVFTAGDDSSAYTSAEAVRDLYNYTRDNDVVLLDSDTEDPSASNLKKVRLFNPIRTMVVGFVDPTDSATADLRDKLNLMADYGDDGKANGSAQAEFANDVPGLIAAMHNVLARVNTKIVLQSSGPVMPVDPEAAEDAPEPEAYAATYMRQNDDQWRGFFTRFKMEIIPETASKSFDIKMTPTWELGDLIYSKDLGTGYAVSDPGQRRLITWDFNSVLGATSIGNLSPVPFPGLVSTPNVLAATMGLETTQLDGYTAGKPHPANLMLRWMHGIDFQYLPATSSDAQRTTVRATQLSDMGNSNYILVGRILNSALHNQPGYRDWAATPAIASRDRTLYVQSNGGMLHALNVSQTLPSVKWPRERWAFIPPNVLANQRLAGLKFRFLVGSDKKQKARWIDGPESIASFMTDGGIRTQNLWDGSNWQTYLFGSMGRGGAGLYALQITNPAAPQFLWAVENNIYTFNTPKPNKDMGTVHFWGASPSKTYQTYNSNGLGGSLSPSEMDYRRLGWNAPAPAIGTTLVGTTRTNVGVLSAGMQYDLDFSYSGGIGAAVYILDPITGKVLKQFNTSSTIAWSQSGSDTGRGANPKMGMMLTPPALVEQPTAMRYLEGFFAADHRGNIFEGRFINDAQVGGGGFHTAISSWTLKRVASLKKDSENSAKDNFAMPFKLTIARDPNRDLWVFGGTADISARNRGEDRADTRSESESSIFNRSQWLFGFRNDRSASAGTLLLREASSVGQLNADISADQIDISVKRGWTIALKPADSSFAREYLSASPLFFNDELFAATFLPDLVPEEDEADKENCTTPNVKGKTHIYRLDARSGKSNWPDSCATKYLVLDGIKVTGLSVLSATEGSRLLISMSILDEDRLNKSMVNGKLKDGKGNTVSGVSATRHSDTLMSIAFDSKAKGSVKGERLNYWREVYTR